MNLEQDMSRKKLVRWIVYLIFFTVLNETVFNVSTPKIAEQFSLSPSGVSWMMTIFLVLFGIGSVVFGKLSDIYSLRRLITIGTLLYNVGSIMGFMLQFSYPWVILSRAIQGIGASAVSPLIFVIIARYYPASERGKIFGFITSAVSFSIGIGPVLGGFVSGALHWSYLFLIPLFTLIAILPISRELPEEGSREGSVDILGAVLLTLAVGAFVVYLNFSHWAYPLLFILFLGAFIVHCRRTADPFIKPSLFKNVKFRNGMIVGFTLFSVVIGILFLIPLMLHAVHGLSTSQIGLVLFPGAMSSVFFGTYGGALADRKGNNFVVVIGLVLLAASMVLMACLLSVSSLVIAAALLMTYIGFTLFQTAMINAISQTLPEHEAGVGMGVFNLIATLSGAVGTALVGKILDGKWMEFSLLSYVSLPTSYAYSNIMLLFSLVVVSGGVLYLRSYRE